MFELADDGVVVDAGDAVADCFSAALFFDGGVEAAEF
jgi:hypothetical protein